MSFLKNMFRKMNIDKTNKEKDEENIRIEQERKKVKEIRIKQEKIKIEKEEKLVKLKEENDKKEAEKKRVADNKRMHRTYLRSFITENNKVIMSKLNSDILNKTIIVGDFIQYLWDVGLCDSHNRDNIEYQIEKENCILIIKDYDEFIINHEKNQNNSIKILSVEWNL